MLPPRRLVLLIILLALSVGLWLWRSPRSRTKPRSAEAAAEIAARAYLALEAREQATATSLWLPELDAQRYEDELLRLWDSLNQAADPWSLLGQFPVKRLVLPKIGANSELADGSHAHELIAANSGQASEFTQDQIGSWLQAWAKAGWTIERTTWAITGHRPATSASSASSRLAVTAQLRNRSVEARATLRFEAEAIWAASDGVAPSIDRLEIRRGELLTRSGPTPFRPWLEALIPADRSVFTDPLIIWDLDGDGFSEVLLVGSDRIWRNRLTPGESRRSFVSEPGLGLPVERIVAAICSDVNGDGQDELVIAHGAGITWWPGQPSRESPGGVPTLGWQAPSPLKHPQVITGGDVDGDGDLDLWVAQYKLPYQGGQFPTPWDDANDGFPAYFLRNDGGGRFTDVTEESGLAPVRFRRTYSASFIDLDLDGDLDLANISDFAGLDVFLNDGSGRFHSVTDRLGAARHAFGMSHVVNDANGDGRPDLVMLGMNSTVADRLGFMNLERDGSSVRRMQEMTVGNRLYWGVAGSVPLQAAPEEMSRELARTGWSWGAAWADFNLDGVLDLAVANGHESRASVRDYERQFWLHDRFVADSRNSAVADLYFRTAMGRRQADQASYGGWQSNVLLLGNKDQTLRDVAWLWGMAVSADCRNLVAEDLDGDGRLDLIITTQEEWPERRQRLLIFRNELPVQPWIGFRFSGPFPAGVRVELETSAGRQTRWCLTGDSYRSQSSATVHFGLGSAEPRSLRWQVPGRAPHVFDQPLAANRWHVLR